MEKSKWFNPVRLTILGLTLSSIVGAQAAPLDLYSARLPVNSQATSVRQQALAQGLHAVLVKVTGQLSFEQEVVQQAMHSPDRYLMEYGYKAIQAEDLVEGRYWLELRYSDRLIDQLVRDAQLPVWGRQRRPTLVWLIEDERGVRKRASEQSGSQVLTALKRRAEQRGLPLMIPSMDLKDSMALPDQDLWGLFADSIREASARYPTAQILAGRVTKGSNGQFQSRWSLILNDRVEPIQASGATPIALGARVIDQLANEVISLYAVNPGAGDVQQGLIEITNLTTPKLVASAEAYLQGLSSVKRAEIMEVKGEHVVFSLVLNGEFGQLMRVINADSKMTPDNGMSDFRGVRARFYYQP